MFGCVVTATSRSLAQALSTVRLHQSQALDCPQSLIASATARTETKVFELKLLRRPGTPDPVDSGRDLRKGVDSVHVSETDSGPLVGVILFLPNLALSWAR